MLEHLIFDEDADYRDVLTTRTTAVNPTLAAIYDMPAPTVKVRLDQHAKDSEQVSLLGHAPTPLNAHRYPHLQPYGHVCSRSVVMPAHSPTGWSRYIDS